MELDDDQILEALFDLAENEELEFKGAKGGFPGSFWETYSAFANTNGGVVILGVRDKNGHLRIDGLTASDIDKLQKDLWSGLSSTVKHRYNIKLLLIFSSLQNSIPLKVNLIKKIKKSSLCKSQGGGVRKPSLIKSDPIPLHLLLLS